MLRVRWLFEFRYLAVKRDSIERTSNLPRKQCRKTTILAEQINWSRASHPETLFHRAFLLSTSPWKTGKRNPLMMMTTQHIHAHKQCTPGKDHALFSAPPFLLTLCAFCVCCSPSLARSLARCFNEHSAEWLSFWVDNSIAGMSVCCMER